MKWLALLALVVVTGCSGAPSPAATPWSVTLHAGENGLVDFAGGRYRVSWDSAGCTSFFVALAPISGPPDVPVAITSPTGSAVVEVPTGRAYVNRGGVCPNGVGAYTVTLSREG